MRSPKPPKKHHLQCTICGGELRCYRTYPRASRVKRARRCVKCEQRTETIELSKAELDAMIKRLQALESIWVPVAQNALPSIVSMPSNHTM